MTSTRERVEYCFKQATMGGRFSQAYCVDRLVELFDEALAGARLTADEDMTWAKWNASKTQVADRVVGRYRSDSQIDRDDIREAVLVGYEEGARLAAEPTREMTAKELIKLLDHTHGWSLDTSDGHPEQAIIGCWCGVKMDGLDEFNEHLEELALARVPDHPPAPSGYPKPCGLCPGTIESREDLDWHGLGNCVDTCARCNGSGVEPKFITPEDAKESSATPRCQARHEDGTQCELREGHTGGPLEGKHFGGTNIWGASATPAPSEREFTLPELNASALSAGIASPHWNALEKQLAKALLEGITAKQANKPKKCAGTP